jgi:hypothetical protein
MSNVHILPDENLGGVLREFVEVDRVANVGEKIVIVDPSYFQYGDWYTQGTVMTVTETDEYGNVYCGKYDLIDRDEYRTLEPTDIVHLREENGTERRDGKPSRFRLVDRKAKVGDRIVNRYDYVPTTVKRVDKYGIETEPYVTKDGFMTSGMLHGSYYVLEPVTEPEPIEVDTRHASPEVIDMLANLAQKVTELERELYDVQDRITRIEDEIDTLHANQRKLAEDTTNRLDRHSERIRELAEMIGERSDKVFNFPIKPFKFSDLNGKTLRIFSAQDVTDKSTTTVTVGIDIHDGNMYVLEVKRK